MSNRLSILLISLLFCSCHTQPSKSPESAPRKPTIDTTNNDAPDIGEIVAEFRDSVQKESTQESSAIINNDTIRVQVKMEVVQGDTFLLPDKYLQEVQLDSLRIWNMRCTVTIFMNGMTKSKIEIGKDNFNDLMDNNLRRYGILMYPEISKIEENEVSIGYSISIPFSDEEIGVVAKIKNGKASYSADQNNPE